MIKRNQANAGADEMNRHWQTVILIADIIFTHQNTGVKTHPQERADSMQVSIRGVYVNEVKVKWIKIMAINDHNIHFYFYKFVLVVVY